MNKRLIILGTGGSAMDALDIVDALNASGDYWEVAGFLDDGRETGAAYMGLSVLGPLSAAPQFHDCMLINTIGSDKNHSRRGAIIARTDQKRERFVTLTHPLASVSKRAKLGVGVCVNYGVSIGGKAVIGDHVYIGPGAIIGHDAIIGDYSIVAPGAVISGFVDIGESCYIGAGSTIRQQIRVGARSLIGMGAVVVRDVEADVTVIGNPARAR
jgi:sugar O-acyltransferase (sialic acid O-acetyltransferase NeuD family)